MQSELTERAKTAWNSIADEFNQWDALGLDEQETYVALTAALVDVPAVEPVPDIEPVAWYMHLWNEADEEIKSDIRWGRPTADDISRAEYNGHDIEHLYPHPPLREGEDSAEAVTLTRAEADRIAQRLEFDASWDKCGDGYYSIKRQLGTLAATRSASATTAKGVAE